MKLKRVLLALAGVLTFSLAACSQATEGGSGSGSGSGTSEGEGSGGSSQTDTSALAFMSNNKIRVDIMDDLGVTFNYGNEAVVSTREITIVNDLTFTYSGDCTVNKVNYIAYVERETGSTTLWHQGLDAVYFLDQVLPRNNFNGVKKVYIAISSGEVQWTTGLSTELDQAFNSRKNAGQV